MGSRQESTATPSPRTDRIDRPPKSTGRAVPDEDASTYEDAIAEVAMSSTHCAAPFLGSCRLMGEDLACRHCDGAMLTDSRDDDI